MKLTQIQALLLVDSLTLRGLPMPPSINKQLGVRGGRLRKTGEAHTFDSEINKWIKKNKNFVAEIRSEMPLCIEARPYLSVDCIFVFHEERILTKGKQAKSPLKVLDANNRLKSALDAVAKIINVDDKHFTSGNCEKATCKTKDQEQLIVKIRWTQLRTLSEIQ